MYELDSILNTRTIPFRHDEIEFQLKPFTRNTSTAFNQAVKLERNKDESDVDYTQRLADARIKIMADHMKGCVSKGDPKKVTPKWLDNLPEVVLVEFLEFFSDAKLPDWYGGQGNASN